MQVQILSDNLPLGLDGYAVSVADSFIHAFTTKKGTVIGNYEYGTEVYLLKHRPYNSSWLIDFKRCCKDACKFDPRLSFEKVVLDDSKVDIGKLNFEVHTIVSVIKGFINV
jgi:hypothetical protein